MTRRRSFILYWLPVVVWMGLIFTASGDQGSFQHSSRLIRPLLHWLFPHVTAETLHNVVVVARKCAHVGEYAILALLVWRALRRPAGLEAGPWHWPDALGTLLVVLLYAAGDEFHQRFVPSREGSVRDVLIDTSGALLALVALWSLHLWQGRRRRNPGVSVVKSSGPPQSEG